MRSIASLVRLLRAEVEQRTRQAATEEAKVRARQPAGGRPMRLFLLAVALSPLLAVPAWSATPGPQVPLAATSGNLSVELNDDFASTAGPFPLTLPFDLASESCAASGVLTADKVGDGVEVTLSTVSLGSVSSACELDTSAVVDAPALEVPDIGGVLTPIFVSLDTVTSGGGGISVEFAYFDLSADYRSDAWGGNLEAPTSISAEANESAGPNFYVPGDTVTFDRGEVVVRWSSVPGAAATFDATLRGETFLPPSAAPPAPAMSPSGRIALGVAMLLTAGLVASRQRPAGAAR